MEEYNYYYIVLDDGKYVYKTRATVGDEKCAKKFLTKVQAVQYAKKYYSDHEFTVQGAGGIKEVLPYEY